MRKRQNLGDSRSWVHELGKLVSSLYETRGLTKWIKSQRPRQSPFEELLVASLLLVVSFMRQESASLKTDVLKLALNTLTLLIVFSAETDLPKLIWTFLIPLVQQHAGCVNPGGHKLD